VFSKIQARRPVWSVERLEHRFCCAAYSIDTIATSGGEVATLGTLPSINDDGTVAFTQLLSTGQDGIFVAPPAGSAVNITPGGRNFRSPVQINNSGLVVNTQQVNLSRNVDVWDSNATDSLNTLVAHAFANPGEPLFITLAFDSIANDGSVVFMGRPGSATGPVVVYRGQVGNNDAWTQVSLPNQNPTPLNLMPMIADGGDIVLRNGANSTDPIRLVGSASEDVASMSLGFSSLGVAPGLSDDGNMASFATPDFMFSFAPESPSTVPPIAGDANRDGLFDSSDLVLVFQAGKYETGESAIWEEGDWNGDLVFDSGDLVVAFQSGRYEQPAAVLDVGIGNRITSVFAGESRSVTMRKDLTAEDANSEPVLASRSTRVVFPMLATSCRVQRATPTSMR
jgi:hypothetical protein